MISTLLATLCKLACPGHRSLNRVQEGSADAGLLELTDGGDRRPTRRGDGLAQLDRVHSLVAQLLRRSEHGLADKRRRDLAGETEENACLDHRFREEGEIRRAGARDG